jgi:hypothetical protein
MVKNLMIDEKLPAPNNHTRNQYGFMYRKADVNDGYTGVYMQGKRKLMRDPDRAAFLNI